MFTNQVIADLLNELDGLLNAARHTRRHSDEALKDADRLESAATDLHHHLETVGLTLSKRIAQAFDRRADESGLRPAVPCGSASGLRPAVPRASEASPTQPAGGPPESASALEPVSVGRESKPAHA